MKFKKEDLQEVCYGDFGDFELIKDEIVETSRWSLLKYQVFKYKDKFYSTSYSEGLTEMQDESPYEYAGDMIECREVVPVSTTITEYINKGA